jgi:hypothetical protein
MSLSAPSDMFPLPRMCLEVRAMKLTYGDQAMRALCRASSLSESTEQQSMPAIPSVVCQEWRVRCRAVLATSHIRSKIRSFAFLASHDCCHLNSIDEEIVRFISRFRETTSIFLRKN